MIKILLSSHPSLVAVALVPKTQLYTTLWYCLNLPLVLSTYLQETEKMFTRFAAFFLFQRKLLFCSFLIKLLSMLSFSKNPWVCQMISLSHTLLISLFLFSVCVCVCVCVYLSLSQWCLSQSLIFLSIFISISVNLPPVLFNKKCFLFFNFTFMLSFYKFFFWMLIDFASFINYNSFEFSV